MDERSDQGHADTDRRVRTIDGPDRTERQGDRSLIERIDAEVGTFLRRWSIPALRISLGLVFVWFGLLKIFDVTPVASLVARTVYMFDPTWVVPTLGFLEVAVGIGLLFKIALRVVLVLFVGQMLGTFLVLPMLPDVAFQDGNPLLLTAEGEFVVKNIVLLSAGLVVGATIPASPPVSLHTETDERLPDPDEP